MRRHGKSAARRELAVAHEVGLLVADAMWTARTVREARAGAIVVAGKHGEVLRVTSVGLDKCTVNAAVAPFHVRPEVCRRVGANWVQEDLRTSGEALRSVRGHVTRDRRSSETPGTGTGQFSTRKPKGTRTQGA